jgi:hypothetical protein
MRLVIRKDSRENQFQRNRWRNQRLASSAGNDGVEVFPPRICISDEEPYGALRVDNLLGINNTERWPWQVDGARLRRGTVCAQAGITTLHVTQDMCRDRWQS